ncbi:MAG: RecT family recombinase, partial [Thermodesulfovibrio sp.]|nr:RecT family recombinase [Thermodesulfovibrio sp.]
EEQKALTSLSREQIELIKRTIAKDATDDELKLFLYTAQKYNLDPFLKEIIFVKRRTERYGEIVNFITTRDGYLKIAMQDPNFQGLQSGVVREGDTFEVIPTEAKVLHKFGEKRGKIICAYAIALHKNRMPVIFIADFEEYYNANQNSPVWKQYPSVMIQKVAEVGALRRQFNISGLVVKEEMYIPEENIEITETKTIPKENITTEKRKRNYQEFWRLVREIGLTSEEIHEIVGAANLKDIDDDYYFFLEDILHKVKNKEIQVEDLKRITNLKNLDKDELNNILTKILFSKQVINP